MRDYDVSMAAAAEGLEGGVVKGPGFTYCWIPELRQPTWLKVTAKKMQGVPVPVVRYLMVGYGLWVAGSVAAGERVLVLESYGSVLWFSIWTGRRAGWIQDSPIHATATRRRLHCMIRKVR